MEEESIDMVSFNNTKNVLTLYFVPKVALNHIAFSNVFHLPRNVVKGKE
jgi:hypothetical protein